MVPRYGRALPVGLSGALDLRIPASMGAIPGSPGLPRTGRSPRRPSWPPAGAAGSCPQAGCPAAVQAVAKAEGQPTPGTGLAGGAPGTMGSKATPAPSLPNRVVVIGGALCILFVVHQLQQASSSLSLDADPQVALGAQLVAAAVVFRCAPRRRLWVRARLLAAACARVRTPAPRMAVLGRVQAYSGVGIACRNAALGDGNGRWQEWAPARRSRGQRIWLHRSPPPAGMGPARP